MTSFASPLRYEVDTGIATITLDRPDARNAFDETMADSLLAALRTAAKNELVRVIVITGRGTAFSAGQDIRELHAKEQQIGPRAAGDELRYRFAPILQCIRTMDQPVIGAINGVATGAGLGIALACDLRLAGERASFVFAPHSVALIPGAGITWLLPRLIGWQRASELTLLGERVDARRAYELGLVQQVVPDDLLLDTTHEFAKRLIDRPATSLALTKRALNRSMFVGFDEQLEYEADLQELAADTEDHRVRLHAMIERGNSNR